MWPRVRPRPHRAGRRRAGGARRARSSSAWRLLTAEESRRRRRPRQATATPRKGFPPLELALGIRDDAEAADLRRAAALYEQGKRQQAAAIFARHDSLEAKLGSAFAAWPASEDRIEQLGALYPAQLARAAPRRARPASGRALAGAADRVARGPRRRAGHALRGPRGRSAPSRSSRRGCPASSSASTTRSRARRRPTSCELLAADRTLRGRLLYGIALQGLGRPVSARRAFDGGPRAGAEQRRRARRRRRRPLRQGKSLGVVLPPRPAQPPVPARGDGALPPRPAAALAEGPEGGDAPARARAQGRAGQQDRRRGEAVPRCGSQRRDLLIERWAERPMALRSSSWQALAAL